ncbi:kinase-like domain-containing protein [Mycena filopes]|nr:kinase-like domain-containing protein [Mycena filopes]
MKMEIWWRDHQVWLQEHCGYMLRPRFRPGWVPSWANTGKLRIQVEDGLPILTGPAIDATRLSDGVVVTLKRVDANLHPHEQSIGELLSSASKANDPRNHCVPILEVIRVPDTNFILLVMPLLRKYAQPRFDTFGEAVDFFGQAIEGLKFMHDLNIAHRDCNGSNIMMDASNMYPGGFHFQHPELAPDFYSGRAKHYTRTQRPPKYYLIDFGLSRVYPSKTDPPPLEPVIHGGDRTPPEFRNNNKCNPFPTDVYYLGNMIRTGFLDGFSRDDDGDRLVGFEFMRPLVNAMIAEDPTKRPTMDEVAERFVVIRRRLNFWKLRSRVVKASDLPFPFSIVRILKHWHRRIGYILHRVPAIPTVTLA